MTELWVQPEAESILKTLDLKSVEDAWRPDFPGEIVNDRGDRQVLRVPVEGRAGAVFLKRWKFAPNDPYRWFPGKGDLRARARTEKENLERLSEGGISVPTPLAMGEEPSFWGPVATFLLLDELVDHRPASDLLPLPLNEMLPLIEGVVRTLGKLHRLELYARSPGLKHFFVTADLESIAMIDVPRLDPPPSSSKKLICQATGRDIPSKERDLSKLWVEWESYHPKVEDWAESFWNGYRDLFPALVDNPDWRRGVVSLAEKRKLAREKNG